jgi:hypothetical protein
MPDTFALLLAVGIVGTSGALAATVLFDEARGRKRSIEHYRNLERERVLRVRRLHTHSDFSNNARPRMRDADQQKDQRAA